MPACWAGSDSSEARSYNSGSAVRPRERRRALMGTNRAGARRVKRLKRAKREAERLALKAAEEQGDKAKGGATTTAPAGKS